MPVKYLTIFWSPFPFPSSPIGCKPFNNCGWNHIESNVFLFLYSLGTWRWCQNCYINLNGTLHLEIVTFIHLFREVINEATMKFIQFLTSVSPGGKVMKQAPRAGSFLELVYKVTAHSIYLSKNMLLRESFHECSYHL